MESDKAGNTATATAPALHVTDERTGQEYDLPIQQDAVRAADLHKIKVGPDDFGLVTYDPGFTATAACKSAITFIDGDKGILEYRGYPIEQIAERSSFEEVCYLLHEGRLPSSDELAAYSKDLGEASQVPESLLHAFDALPTGMHPMGLLGSLVSALGAFHPEARDIKDADNDKLQARRLVAEVPTLAAAAYRVHRGQKAVQADPDLPYVERFLVMLFADSPEWRPDPRVVTALDKLFILHADHEQNCSTSTVRVIGSAEADPYASVSGGIQALSGPLHGGANEEVLRMLREIGSKDRIPTFIEEVKAGRRRLMGFGHRVYKSYDPRAKVIKAAAESVFEVTGVNPLLEIAQELEQIALHDDYFISRRLYPNVDFYSGLIYEALGFPPEMFTVLFAVGRTPGWTAHWLESVSDPDRKIARPRQLYTGPRGVQFPART
ncbi:MAG: citrate synthase [Candidatus Dormibacteraeota bacterium]|nr:citrate synthase [Candidatus Dormibacteraeota bacterium]